MAPRPGGGAAREATPPLAHVPTLALRYEDGERRQKARKEFRASSLSHTPPTHAELELVYDLFMASGTGDAAHLRQPLREGQVHGHKTTMTTMMLCHPQNRNIHGKVFGGFLMLHA